MPDEARENLAGPVHHHEMMTALETDERLLTALAGELAEATDEEILEAAKDLGMNPTMRGSAAFFGVTIPVGPPFTAPDPRDPAEAPGGRHKPKDDPPH